MLDSGEQDAGCSADEGRGRGEVIFRQFLHEQRSCASYLIGCPSERVAAIVDPQRDPTDYESAAARSGLRITEVIESHIHADHVSGARELVERTGAMLRLGAEAGVDFDFTPMSEGDVIEVGNRRVRVLHTPGHTPEHVCLLVDDWFVLTGDTLFVGDVGRVDLALQEVDDGELRDRARELYTSLQKLLKLPPETEVYPGHYAGSTCGRGMDGKTISTIARENRSNRALGLGLEDFIDFQLSSLPPLPEDFESIKRMNVSQSREATSESKEVTGE
jgi:glyoxylase-like metal-dependent hydrolase (beta-lactamase superfamily II)